MFKKLAFVCGLAVIGAGLLGAACKKDEDKFCEAIRKFEKNYSEQECKKDIDDIKKDCTNPDEVISCVAGSDTENAAEACMGKCKEKQ